MTSLISFLHGASSSNVCQAMQEPQTTNKRVFFPKIFSKISSCAHSIFSTCSNPKDKCMQRRAALSGFSPSERLVNQALIEKFGLKRHEKGRTITTEALFSSVKDKKVEGKGLDQWKKTIEKEMSKGKVDTDTLIKKINANQDILFDEKIVKVDWATNKASLLAIIQMPLCGVRLSNEQFVHNFMKIVNGIEKDEQRQELLTGLIELANLARHNLEEEKLELFESLITHMHQEGIEDESSFEQLQADEPEQPPTPFLIPSDQSDETLPSSLILSHPALLEPPLPTPAISPTVNEQTLQEAKALVEQTNAFFMKLTNEEKKALREQNNQTPGSSSGLMHCLLNYFSDGTF